MSSANLQPYADLAFLALQSSAQSLFQARKIGVQVTVPDAVRQEMVARHGSKAQEMLNLLDGKVTL
ncbi:hypothetical protein WL29_23115 [Burkholderia ubonensis]|uniref:Uncharacterized protein n=1 Tax=Burkholderia ubonensis TaxID=101571 RepID=A0A106QCB2_9BURK|nr:hypothetical protein [Burkholderia ubonensis]KWA84253.1 hypothetical protein WL29_23115 [Burkholderia ubonensis]